MSDWKVRLHHAFNMDATEILIYRERQDGAIELMRFGEPTRVLVSEAEAVPGPSLFLPGRIARPVLQAFADELHSSGVKPTNQSFIEGELSATKKHLEDMRGLVLRRKVKEI